jgi:ABC-2 type transport system ATP-binding protein
VSAAVTPGADGSLTVLRATAANVGDLAAAHQIPPRELVTVHATLEEAFMRLTKDALDYRAAAAALRARDA